MSGNRERWAIVTRLWQEHLAAAFPARSRGVELEGVDMVMLDSTIAGCVSTWRSNNGSLDAERLRTLCRCVADLDDVLPLLTDKPELEYYRRLHLLATLVSRAEPRKGSIEDFK